MDGQPLFPGDSDVDQLYIIQKLLGPITAKQSVVFLKNPRFSGFRFGDDLACRPHELDKRYGAQVNAGKLTPAALDFMKSCLRMDPAQRLTITECLHHPYFASLHGQPEPVAAPPTAPTHKVLSAKRRHSAQESAASAATHADARDMSGPLPMEEGLPPALADLSTPLPAPVLQVRPTRKVMRPCRGIRVPALAMLMCHALCVVPMSASRVV